MLLRCPGWTLAAALRGQERGAGFAADLALPAEPTLLSNATRSEAEALSGLSGADLAARLPALGVPRVVGGGLASDYCLRPRVRDLVAEGLALVVLTDAVRTVDVQPGDCTRAPEEMRQAGAELRTRGAPG